MDETRANAAITELNTLVIMLVQRNLNYAGDVATLKGMLELAQKEIESLKTPVL